MNSKTNIMKAILIIFSLFLFAFTTAWSQENLVSFSGGYAFSHLEDVDQNLTGYRINGLYEYNPGGGMLAHGWSFGYIGTSGESSIGDGSEFKMNTWPLYYAPKLMFGKNKLKLLVKGAMGLHFSNFKRTGALLDLDTNDTGFYGGAGAGLMIYLKENIFLNAEYEWAFMSNIYYRNAFMNSANLSFGFRF